MTDWISYADMIIQKLQDKSISQDDVNYADQLVRQILSNSEAINSKYSSMFSNNVSINYSYNNMEIVPNDNDITTSLLETSIKNNNKDNLTSFISVEEEKNEICKLNSNDTKNTHNDSCMSMSPILSAKKSNSKPTDITINIESLNDTITPLENQRYLSIKPVSVGSLLFSQHIPEVITSQEKIEKIHELEQSKNSIILLYKSNQHDSMIQTLFDYLISHFNESPLPSLIVCPASIVDEVSRVFENNNQSLKIYNHRGKNRKSWISPQYIENYNIILTTYYYLGIQECLPLSEDELKKRRNNKSMIKKPIIQNNVVPVSCLHLVLWNRVIVIDSDLLLHKEKKKFRCVNQLYTNHMIFVCKDDVNDKELFELISSKNEIEVNKLNDYIFSC